MSEEEFLEIEPLGYATDDEVESFIDVEPKEPIQEDKPVNKTKRLVCMIEGCSYKTDRRRDMRRHRRSQKHIRDMANIADSDSDFERPLYNCPLCSYTTAKKFCFDRHNMSTKHRCKVESQGDPLLRKQKVKILQSARRDTTSSQESDGVMYTCAACEYTTHRKESFKLHKTKRKHRYIMDIMKQNNQIITSGPMAQGDEVEYTPPESEDEAVLPWNAPFYCDLCEYQTNTRYSFLRHKKSKKHQARVQEIEDMEEKSDSLPDADTFVTSEPEVQQEQELEYEETIEYDPLVQEEVVVEQEPDFQEIIYLPEGETGEEQHYFIVLSND
ncbi:GL12415 [Drosophila persimilis]|uniref:GL12415 n=1 Tax=Drosophila persimilis TaxID=7234 RepID=B4GMN2_DROPE|nr:zinc finger homeobox protein 3 [Drosophila persimilis]EDW38106.1 GL12415 [Drosophila persimilis]